MKKPSKLFVVIAAVTLVFLLIGIVICCSTSKEEQEFINAVNGIGEVNEDSYQKVKDAYALLKSIDYDRRQVIPQDRKDSFEALKQANVELYNLLADRVPDTFESYLSSNGSDSDWIYPRIKAKIPEDVLKEFCENNNNREALQRADEVHGWLSDEMWGRSNMFEYWDKCDQRKYKKVLHYSIAVKYYDELRSGKLNNTSKKSSGTCINCGGSGRVKYWNVSSDLEAEILGPDAYEFGVCPMCNGTGISS